MQEKEMEGGGEVGEGDGGWGRQEKEMQGRGKVGEGIVDVSKEMELNQMGWVHQQKVMSACVK